MLDRDVVRGAVGFSAVGVAAFSVWAFGRFRDEIVLYAATAAVFLGLSGLLLFPLAGGLRRFYLTFVPAFLAYAAVWSFAYLAWRTRLAEWLASAAGCAAFAVVLGLRSPAWIPRIAVVLFLTHSAGYFLGGDLYEALKGTAGRLLWGLSYGLGFGAGLGYAYRSIRPRPR